MPTSSLPLILGLVKRREAFSAELLHSETVPASVLHIIWANPGPILWGRWNIVELILFFFFFKSLASTVSEGKKGLITNFQFDLLSPHPTAQNQHYMTVKKTLWPQLCKLHASMCWGKSVSLLPRSLGPRKGEVAFYDNGQSMVNRALIPPKNFS